MNLNLDNEKGFTPLELSNGRKKLLTGFTLIELLVVVAVIGMLASVIVVGLGNARIKSRDARRLSDVQQIRSALDLYLNQGGGYPDQSVWVPGSFITCNAVSLFTVPIDPGVGYTYVYRHMGTLGTATNCGAVYSGYVFQFQTEAGTDLGPAGYYCLRPIEGISSGLCP